MTKKTKIAVVDDHKLFRGGLIQLIHALGTDLEVILEADNGESFINKLKGNEAPDIALIDINMPKMDGFKTVEILQEEYPDIKVLVVSMNEDETSLIRMLKLGVRGYIGKDIEPDELRVALNEIITKGYYYTDQLTGQLINSLKFPNAGLNKNDQLNKQELKFIQLACSEDTYEKIADIMCLSPKTIDGYRASVFDKLKVKSRVGLALYAVKSGLVDL